MKQYTTEEIREIARIGFEVKKPFESVPASEDLKKRVKLFQQLLKIKSTGLAYQSKSKKLKRVVIRPINANCPN